MAEEVKTLLPEEEGKNIMNILRDYLKDVDNFKDENIKL